MIHAPLSAGNLAIDAPPSASSAPPLPTHFLPLTARTASQLPLTLSDCYLQHEAVYSSPQPPGHLFSVPTFSPLFPTVASFRRSSAYLIISANSFRDTYRSRSRAKFQNTQAVTLKIIAGQRQRRRRRRQQQQQQQQHSQLCEKKKTPTKLYRRVYNVTHSVQCGTNGNGNGNGNKTTIRIWFLVFNCS